MATSQRIWRIGAIAFLADLSMYLVWVAIPYRAITLGAGAASLGLLPAISAASYVLSTLLSGRLADRISRLGLARFGAVIFAIGSLLVMKAGSLGELMLRLPAIGLGMGIFWPPMQAALADEDRTTALERNVGLFNVCWASGKALGFLVGGSLYARFDADPLFWIGSATMVMVTVLVPRPRPEAGHGAEPEGDDDRHVSPLDLRALLITAWVANAVAFGIANTMNIQYPKFLLEIGHGSEAFGLYLGATFGSQMAAFLILRRFRAWRLHPRMLYVVQGIMALAVVALSTLRALPLILLTAIPIGLGLGFAYHASITYSLVDRRTRGRRAGIHEALLGTGNFLLPLVGGLLAAAAGDLRMPYWVCGVAVAISVGGQEVIWRRRITRPLSNARS